MNLRLVKVVCQPHFVLEDEEGNLFERVSQPVEVAAKDWPAYSGERFPADMAALEAELATQPAEDAKPPPPPRKRAQQRKRK